MVLDILIAGAAGGLIKTLLEGGHKLAAPKFEEGYLYLGFLGNVLIGAVVAYFLAGDTISAFTAGITSNFIIEGFIERAKTRKPV